MKIRFIRIKKIRTADEEARLLAELVTSIDDLLVEILLRLPAKSLIRFKCVSKHWLSIISNPQFASHRNPNPRPAVGLFLHGRFFYRDFKFQYISLSVNDPATPPFQRLRFTMDATGIAILQSCNGLLLCTSLSTVRSKRTYYVYNPTTKQLTVLPEPRHGPYNFRRVALAFDPAKSPYYKVVCLRQLEADPGKYQIEIYSSEAGPWRASGEPVVVHVNFELVVYWNRAVHWINTWVNEILYFSVDEERLGVIPMPPIPDGWEFGRKVAYFGESCGHLHLIVIYDSKIRFGVYELKRDYSKWFVKYQVDLAEVPAAFPRMVSKYSYNHTDWYKLSIFDLIRGEKDEDAYLVLQIPGKAIRYALTSRNFEVVCEFESVPEDGELWFSEYNYALQHSESLCCI